MKMVKKAIAVLICGVVLTACATPSQMYWDHKVKELCEKDGGVTVYEQVEILKIDYPNLKTLSNGDLIIPYKNNVTVNDPFYLSDAKETVINDSPKVTKSERYLIRQSDNKIIAKNVFYWRFGGDLVSIDHPSFFSCKDADELNYKKLNSAISIK